MTQARLIRSVTPSGRLVTIADEESAQLLEEDQIPGVPTSTTLVLNRPKVLNALTEEMFNALYNRISYIDSETRIRTIVLKSRGRPGRAFCAGGDVRSIAQVGRGSDAGDFRRAYRMFRMEYQLNALLGALKQSAVIPIMDGIVMGGGAGLCIHGKWRVATERTVFAMPEAVIGLHPDIGSSYVFSRLSIPGLGAYLALSGARLSGLELVTSGIATHLVRSDDLETLEKAVLVQDADVGAILDSFDVQKDETKSKNQSNDSGKNEKYSTVFPCSEVLDKCFGQASCVEDVIRALETFIKSKREITEKESTDNVAFAKKALEKLNAGSPMSLKVAWEMLQRAKTLTLNECLKLEFRLTVRLISRNDFFNGVQSALITKDYNPKWEPPSLAEVSEQDVQNIFRDLKDDLGIEELNLDRIGGHSEGDSLNDDPHNRPKL